MKNLTEIEGVGEAYQHKLNDAGIKSCEQLLDSCSSPKARKQIAQKTGINEAMLLKWLNNADLFRVKGIGQEYADLLESAGVDTVPELAQRNSANLFKALGEINAEKKLVRKMPTQKQLQDWISQAKELPRMINY